MRSRIEYREKGIKVGEHLLEVDAFSMLMIVLSLAILCAGLLSTNESIYRISLIYLVISIAGISIASVTGGFKIDEVFTRIEFINVMKYGLIGVILVFIVQGLVFNFAQPSFQLSMMMVALIFAGATAEELFFRGGLFNFQMVFVPHLLGTFFFGNILLNNMIFALYHYSKMMAIFGRVSLPYLMAIFLSGIIITVMGIISHKLATCIITHSVFNMMATYSGGASMLSIATPEGIITAFYYTLLVAFVSSLYRYLYEKKRKDFLKTQKGFVILLIFGACSFPIAIMVSPWLGAVLVSVLLFQIFDKIEMFWKKRNNKKEEKPFPYYPKEETITKIKQKLGEKVCQEERKE